MSVYILGLSLILLTQSPVDDGYIATDPDEAPVVIAENKMLFILEKE